MRVVISKAIVPRGYVAITVFPFIFIRSEYWRKEKIINHERIHLAQQKELLVLAFYVWYLIDYIVKFIKYRNHKQAYRNIIFEREAYASQNNLNYLKKRKLYSFLKK